MGGGEGGGALAKELVKQNGSLRLRPVRGQAHVKKKTSNEDANQKTDHHHRHIL